MYKGKSEKKASPPQNRLDTLVYILADFPVYKQIHTVTLSFFLEKWHYTIHSLL